MTTAWPITANLSASSDAINGTTITGLDAAGAAFNVGATASGRASQIFGHMVPTLGAQADAVDMLAWLVAYYAATSCAQKYQTEAVVDRIGENATLLLDEIFGLRKMPLHRPDNDQVAALIQQIALARAAAELSVLPPLSVQ